MFGSFLQQRSGSLCFKLLIQGRRAEDVCRTVQASLNSLLSPLSDSLQPYASPKSEEDSKKHLLSMLLAAVHARTAASYAAFLPDESAVNSRATDDTNCDQQAQSNAASGSAAVDQHSLEQTCSHLQQASNTQVAQHRKYDRSTAALCPALCEAASAVMQLAATACQTVQPTQPQYAASSQHQEAVQKLARECIAACSDFTVRLVMLPCSFAVSAFMLLALRGPCWQRPCKSLADCCLGQLVSIGRCLMQL